MSLKQEEGWDRVSREMVSWTQRGGAGPSDLDLHKLLFSKTQHLLKVILLICGCAVFVGAHGFI